MRWFYSVFIIALLVLVSGVDQCAMPGGDGQASKSGLGFSLIQGVGYFRQGMELEQGETFKVALKIENYDRTEKSGKLCIRDDKDPAYGGIYEDCLPFYIGEAEYNGDQFVQSKSVEVYFPIDMEYSYHDIPIAQPGKIFVVLSYAQHSTVQGSISVPEPQQETVKLTQTSAPVSVAVEKTISKQTDQYKVNAAVTLTKQSDANLKLYTEDMKKENAVSFRINLEPGYDFDCAQGITSMESTKFIKCSALLPLEQVTNPLLIYLDYGVKITNSFDFKIKAKEGTK